jgi:hypothetical protein
MRASHSMRGAPNAVRQNGTNWAHVTFVEIRWGWLAFLVVELVVAAGFLAATVVCTQRMGVQVLKSSALATFFAPAEDCRAAMGGVGRVGEMRRRARGAYVRFNGTEMVLTEREEAPAADGPERRGGFGRMGTWRKRRPEAGTW